MFGLGRFPAPPEIRVKLCDINQKVIKPLYGFLGEKYGLLVKTHIKNREKSN
jgi:hypothetical protein